MVSVVPVDSVFIRGAACVILGAFGGVWFNRVAQRMTWGGCVWIVAIQGGVPIPLSDLCFVVIQLALAYLVDSRATGVFREPIKILTCSAFVFVGVAWIPPLSNTFYSIIQRLDSSIVKSLGIPNYSYTYIPVPMLLVLVVSSCFEKKWRMSSRFFVVVVFGLVVTAVRVGLSTVLTLSIHYLCSIGLNLILCSFVVWICFGNENQPQLDQIRMVAESGRRSRFRLVSVLVAVLVVISAVQNQTSRSKAIVFLNHGGLDWIRPSLDPNAKQIGMFGLLPFYLSSAGFECNAIRLNEIERIDEIGASVLVMINCGHFWTVPEKAAVRDFVSKGGSLVVLGDHTNVFGLQNGFNSLLDDIKFEFDSAYPYREGWRGSLSTSTSYPICRYSESNQGVAIGASLALSGWGQRMVWSHHAFSDFGVKENYVGSYLGNYSRDTAEPAGDCVLIAQESLGNGRIVVFGDTSAFQNAMPYNFDEFVFPFFRAMSMPTRWIETRQGMVFVSLSAFALFILLMWDVVPMTIIVGLAVGMVAHQSIQFWSLGAFAHQYQSILVDESHIPNIGHSDSLGQDCGSLYTELLRTGYLVRRSNSFQGGLNNKPKLIAFVDPSRRFTREEQIQLLEYERNGGLVLLVLGTFSNESLREFLEANGVEIGNSLGAVQESIEGEKLELTPRFRDAYSLQLDLKTAQPVLRSGSDIVCSLSQYGSGRLAVIADPRFFSKANAMKSHFESHPGNRRLCEEIFLKFLELEPLPSKPFFPDPTNDNT